MKTNFNPFSGTFDMTSSKATEIKMADGNSLQDVISDIGSPFQLKGDISANSDFPTTTDVDNGWTYTIKADVTDDDDTKTNTGQVFKNEDIISWNGTDWTDITGHENTASEIKDLYESNSDTNVFDDDTKTKLDGIEDSATADQTGAEIKTAYEGEDDTNAFTDSLKTKLDGIADGAETNVQTDYAETDDTLDSFVKNKPDLSVYEIIDNKVTSFQSTPDDTHYISEKLAKDSLDLKVDTESGKGLSANDFTDTLKTKLDGVADNAEVNVQVDYTETDDTLDNFVKNKPDLSVYQTNANMIDEDDMASDSDTKYPTQQSVKRYVNDNLSGDKLQYFGNKKLITESFTTADGQNQIMIGDIELDDDVEITVGDDSNLTILDV